MRILVVEDEAELALAVASGLRREGYAVDIAGDGAAAYERLDLNEYDLVCLDLGLPDVDGMSICRALAEGEVGDPSTRVLVLTARGSVEDRVAGLDAGADDFLVKPFALGELSARVRALLRRDAGRTNAVLRIGDLELDAAGHVALRNGQVLPLTAKELALLRYFMMHPGVVLTAERLLEHVWDEQADPFTNTVRVTISNLRRKLAAAGDGPIIDTVIGRGYRLAVAA
ncbi:MAG: response regulator transcription factor [Actinomycetota bacterium]|nr:response regulator transcription factor [Actinomycetota bacterium]